MFKSILVLKSQTISGLGNGKCIIIFFNLRYFDYQYILFELVFSKGKRGKQAVIKTSKK